MKLSLVACGLALTPSIGLAQTALVSLNGQAGERFGSVVRAYRDVNSDGYADLLVGAPGANSGNGAVYVVSGRYLVNATGPSTLAIVTPGTTNGTGYAFGTSIVRTPDMTGDGVADFIVGAPGIDSVA